MSGYKEKTETPEKKKAWLIILIAAGILIIGAITTLFIIRPDFIDNLFPKPDTPEPDGIVVPWNPGGTADLVTRSLMNQASPEMNIRNVHGANGAAGLNEVYNASHDGKMILGTNLSALISANITGFTEVGFNDWEIWLTAYSPTIIAVSADSPYKTLDDLIAVAKTSELRCANAGNGTLGFISAHLFADSAGIDVKHDSYSGTNPAVNAVKDGEADFITALSSELIGSLRSGELHALASLSDGTVNLTGVTESIPSAAENVPALTDIIPFGEYYGLMLPKNTPSGMLNSYDSLFREAAESEAFSVFADDKGLIRLDVNREYGAETISSTAPLICRTLYDTGCVNVSPETLGIS